MKLSASLAAFAYASTAHAWFRLPCTEPLVSERVDPIISPGKAPSQHAHTVHGGSNFNPTYSFNDSRASSCTSCTVAQDNSNYWFPKLYFKDPKTGLFEDVPNGGLLVYYQNRGSQDVANHGPGLKAFPPGFRMLSGDATRRALRITTGLDPQAALAERATEWSCLRYTNPDAKGYDSNGAGFPNTDCEAGFNARVHMPACWDGKNIDSPNHKDHVAYLSGLDNGNCPATHPVGFMKLFYEVTWDVHAFASRWNPNSQAWPFVYATGDPTGYSWHADFQNGWDTTVLQNAIDKCNNPNDATGSGDVTACKYFTMIPKGTASQCKIKPIVNEVISGNLTKLPGCNPVQYGPGNATIYTDANCPK